ncbi:MAG: YihY/virulence factor BrkB family protein [Pseudomonadota bacterium]
MTDLVTPTRDFFRHRLWVDEGRGPGQLLAVKVVRILFLSGRGLRRNQSLVRSSALAYATILGFIPLLALLFAILQAIGLPRLLATYMVEKLAPGSREFATQILVYIEATKVTSLGVFGVVALLAALVIVMTNVERAFNQTWQISRARTFSRKVSDYLSIFLIFPILMAVALSISTSFLSLPTLRHLLSDIMPEFLFTATRWLISLGLIYLAFIFIYLVMPNARVSFTSAFLGGVVGGSIWQGAQWIFILIQGAATYYNAIYGALYNLLFLFIWMFWSWLILLFGTEVAFAHQHLERLSRQFRRSPAPPEPVDEYLGLAALVGISARFLKRQPPLSLEELAQILPRSNNLASRVIQLLQDCHLIVEVALPKAAPSPQFQPALPLDRVTVKEVLDCLRQARGAALEQALEAEPRLAALLKPLLEAPSPAPWQSLTLRELVESFEQEMTA